MLDRLLAFMLISVAVLATMRMVWKISISCRWHRFGRRPRAGVPDPLVLSSSSCWSGCSGWSGWRRDHKMWQADRGTVLGAAAAALVYTASCGRRGPPLAAILPALARDPLGQPRPLPGSQDKFRAEASRTKDSTATALAAGRPKAPGAGPPGPGGPGDQPRPTRPTPPMMCGLDQRLQGAPRSPPGQGDRPGDQVGRRAAPAGGADAVAVQPRPARSASSPRYVACGERADRISNQIGLSAGWRRRPPLMEWVRRGRRRQAQPRRPRSAFAGPRAMR